ncbi:uncharacterized protein LOC117895683 isoform X1 [Drosophila subobscura]|uniref:uncharacterized protein LOC117895683 isoform X1 n=2 Tax=Drosophila subobscura TaxID=7241 RepID=UPI00155AF937|nr:uncharacterized protein LOC117895683 isoform X1 [Drosophila subobscura]
MTSIVPNLIPPAGVGAAVPIWMKIDWSPEIEHGIYKDWGSYYSGRRRENMAMYYYNKALSMLPEDHVTLYHRSQTKRKNAQTEGALKDCNEAKRILNGLKIKNAPINLEICDAIYELNQLEIAKAELHDNTRQFKGNKTKSFEKRLVVVDENIKNCCGEELTQFIAANEKLLVHVKQQDLRARSLDKNKPLWKLLKEQSKCDVLSIPEIEDELLSPLEVARRHRAFDVFNQIYMDKSWIDVVFLKQLLKNPTLLLEQCKNSKYFLGALNKKKYDELKKFLKMLHARAPMYYLRYNKFTNKKLMDKFREDYLYRKQYQTSRNMLSVLRSIRKLRDAGNIAKLSRYVEEVMGNYVVLKTDRIMPWKFEFMNEVYNTLALAFAEQCRVPHDKNRHSDKDALLKLLRLPTDKSWDVQNFVFGDRSTHQDAEISDPSLSKSRLMITRLEKRMLFAKYSIEKCYLLHQIGYTHLKSNRFDECCFAARKGLNETKNCNSLIYRFLCTLLIIKSNAALHKVERTKEALMRVKKMMPELRSPRISHFVDVCIALNEEEFNIKKQRGSIASRHQSATSLLTLTAEETETSFDKKSEK